VDTRWQERIRNAAGEKPSFQWPGDWQQHPFPFIDGHFDSSLYPTSQWREASRMALGARIVREGSVTEGGAGDPTLVEEIRTKMLPRRGINARPDEILITLGEQNALYLLTQLLSDDRTRVVVEEPGNPRMRRLLLGEDNYALIVTVAALALVVSLLAIIPPARMQDRTGS